MAKKMDFDSAYKELQEIVHKMQADDVEIEMLSSYIKKANELKNFCYTRLREIEDDIIKVTNPQ